MSNLAKKPPCGTRRRLAIARSSIVGAILTIAAFTACADAKAEEAGLLFVAPPAVSVSQASPLPLDKRTAIEQVLKHIYAVYLGIRSCTEISTMQNDNSFRPEVSLDESRQVLRQLDAAASEVGINTSRIWDAEAPIALITAEGLKTLPETHLVFCQRMGSIFRVDAGNLQAGLAQVGAKTPIITKDY